MAKLLSDSLNWCAPFVKYSPLNAGANSEPAISNANLIVQMIRNAPFTWPDNRNEVALPALTVAQQDYAKLIADFGFLEKCSLAFNGKTFEIDVKNTAALGLSSEAGGRPKAVSVKSNDLAGNIGFRFMAAPDQAYVPTLTYQKLAPILTVTGLTLTLGVYSAGPAWPLPDQFSDIYNMLLLGLSCDAVDDPQRGASYWNRGLAALLSKAEGLTETEQNIFLAQWYRSGNQALAAQTKTQQGIQARAQG